MDDFLKHIDDKEAFKEQIKNALDQASFAQLDGLKKEMANEFLKSGDDE